EGLLREPEPLPLLEEDRGQRPPHGAQLAPAARAATDGARVDRALDVARVPVLPAPSRGHRRRPPAGRVRRLRLGPGPALPGLLPRREDPARGADGDVA